MQGSVCMPPRQFGCSSVQDEDDDDKLNEERMDLTAEPIALTTTASPGSDAAKMNHNQTTDSGIFSSSAATLNEAENDSGDNRSECSTPDRKYLCPICETMLTSQHEFTLHIRSHNNNDGETQDAERGFTCRICQKVLSSSSSLDRHVLVHSGERPFTCKHCGDTFTTNGNMHRHMRTHKAENYESDGSTDSNNSAGSKGVEFNNNKVEKRRSEDEICGSARKKLRLDNQNEALFKCPICERDDFLSVKSLEMHLEDNHPDYPAKCHDCNKVFKNNKTLGMHRSTVHADENGKVLHGFKDLTFVDFSSEKFPHIARYECEKNLHKAASGIKFQCTKCSRAFPSDRTLEIHSKSCGLLDLTVSNEGGLDLKSRAREGDMRRSDFFSRLDLQDNSPQFLESPKKLQQKLLETVKSIDGSKDLADIQSIISMTTNGSILQHLQAKTAESEEKTEEEESQDVFAQEFRKMKLRGEFPCRLCTAVFPNLRALKGHNRTHLNSTNNGTYRCNMCPHSSVDKAALIRHMRTHNGDRPYECSLCNYAFTTKANCERHLRNRHAKSTREEVKKSIIYHPSEDPTNEDISRQLEGGKKLPVQEISNEQLGEKSAGKTLTPAFPDFAKIPEDFSALQMLKQINKTTQRFGISDLIGENLKTQDFLKSLQKHEGFVKMLQEQRPDEGFVKMLQEQRSGESFVKMLQEQRSGEGFAKMLQEQRPGESFAKILQEQHAGDNFVKLLQEQRPVENFAKPPPKNPEDFAKPGESFLKSLQEQQSNEDFFKSLQKNCADEDFVKLLQKHCSEEGFMKTLQELGCARTGENFARFLQENCGNDAFLKTLRNHCIKSEFLKTLHEQNTGEDFVKLLQKDLAKESFALQEQRMKTLQEQQAGKAFLEQQNEGFLMKNLQERNAGEFLLKQESFVKADLAKTLQKKHEDFTKTLQEHCTNEAFVKSLQEQQLNNNEGFVNYQTSTPQKQVPKIQVKNLRALKEIPESETEEEEPMDLSKKKREEVKVEPKQVAEAPNLQMTDILAQQLLKNSPKIDPAALYAPQLAFYRNSFPNWPAFPLNPLLFQPPMLPQDPQEIKERLQRLQLCGGGMVMDFAERLKTFYPPIPNFGNESPVSKPPEEIKPLSLNLEKPTLPSAKTAELLQSPNSVKMVIKNGVLMPKQKQRRYRTERPFSCEHCSARFTLRSNMERHIKQQHPQYWSQRQRSSVGNPGRKPQLLLKNNLCEINVPNYEPAKPQEIEETTPNNLISDKLKFAILAQHLRANSQEAKKEEDEECALVIDENEDERKVEVTSPRIYEEKPRPVKGEEGQDLVPVSRLLDNASRQPFREYFREENETGAISEEDEEGLVASGSTSEGNSGTDENRSESDNATNQPLKKKSAYSLAPNRVSCPYCSRKFPWTSSLRRHILTHTGQKPFKCSHCPLLFTTKSNCDRHLLRKHGNTATTISNESSNNNNFMMRNVPERPFKCSSCPSSTFSTYSNLKKHKVHKHGVQDDRQGYEAGSSEDEKNNSDQKSDWESQISHKINSEGQVSNNSDLPFKCHLCDHSFGERQDCLDHIKDKHASEYDLLMSKNALDANASTPDEGNHDDEENEIRGKFPDYSNRKVICAFCMRRFWSAEDLRRHMRTHTGERPFSCDICRRRFTLKHSMLRHRKKHNVPFENDNANSDEDNFEKVKLENNNLVRKTSEDSDGNEGSDLISNLLGIRDRSIIEQVLTASADDAAKLLGVGGQE